MVAVGLVGGDAEVHEAQAPEIPVQERRLLRGIHQAGVFDILGDDHGSRRGGDVQLLAIYVIDYELVGSGAPELLDEEERVAAGDENEVRGFYIGGDLLGRGGGDLQLVYG